MNTAVTWFKTGLDAIELHRDDIRLERHQFGDAAGRASNLTDQTLHLEGGRQPAQGVGRCRAGAGDDAIHPGFVSAG